VYSFEAGDEASISIPLAASPKSRRRNAKESPTILNTVALQSALSHALMSIAHGMMLSIKTSAAETTVAPWLLQLSRIAKRERLYLRREGGESVGVKLRNP
jgi:hypothetical protein